MKKRKFKDVKGRVDVLLSQYMGAILANDPTEDILAELDECYPSMSLDDIEDSLLKIKIIDRDGAKLVARTLRFISIEKARRNDRRRV